MGEQYRLVLLYYDGFASPGRAGVLLLPAHPLHCCQDHSRPVLAASPFRLVGSTWLLPVTRIYGFGVLWRVGACAVRRRC